MVTITIPKREYEELVEKRFRYEQLRELVESDIFAPPPTNSIKEVIGAFKSVNKHSHQFLKSLRKGLERSSYFKA